MTIVFKKTGFPDLLLGLGRCLEIVMTVVELEETHLLRVNLNCTTSVPNVSLLLLCQQSGDLLAYCTEVIGDPLGIFYYLLNGSDQQL